MDEPDTLLAAVAQAELDTDRAREVLLEDEYAQEVRAAQARYKMQDIHGVPAFILNNKFLIEGAQPVEHLAAAIQQAAKRAREDAPSESTQ